MGATTDPAGVFCAAGGLRLGVVGYYRRTVASPQITVNGPRTRMYAMLGPALRFAYRPAAADFRLLLVGGLDLVPRTPAIGYDAEGGYQTAHTPWNLQPRVGFGFDFGSSP